jgi:putative spermidine/putrescine transport system permease protein
MPPHQRSVRTPRLLSAGGETSPPLLDRRPAGRSTTSGLAGRFRVNAWSALALPALVIIGLFFAYPVVEILRRSLTDFQAPEVGGLDNYRWFFDTAVNVTVLKRTFSTAAIVTLVTGVVAFPYAYLMTLVGPRARLLMLALVLVPFWTSLMVRNYAWIVLLQPNGPVNGFLDAVGIGRVELLGTLRGVVIGMSQVLLPFVVLPMYARLRNVDRRLLLAAQSLGAPPWRAFLRVYLPLSMPGLLAGALLAFVLSLGFYITPVLLGSSQQTLISPLIVTQISELLNWGRAGAIAAVLLFSTLLLLAIVSLASRRLLLRSEGSDVADGATLGTSHPRRSVGRVALRVWCGIVGVWLLAPTLVVIPLSFTGTKTFSFPPKTWSTQWWTELFTDPEWKDAIVHSVQIALVVAVLATIIGTAAALALSRGRLPAQGAFSALFLSPLIVPIVVSAIGIYAVFIGWHLTGTFWGFVVAHTVIATPFAIVPTLATLRGFDRRLEMAAASLGAGPVTTFRKVTLPLIRAGMLSGTLFAFAASLDETVVSLFLVSPTYRTLPVQMFTSVTRDVDPTVAAAATLIFLLTSVIVAAALVGHMRRKVVR